LEKEKHLQGTIGAPEKTDMKKVAVNLALLPRLTTIAILRVDVKPALPLMRDGMIATWTVAVNLDPLPK